MASDSVVDIINLGFDDTAKSHKVILKDSSGDAIDSTNPLPIESFLNGLEDTDNSNSSTLAIDGVFDGEWVDTLNYNNIIIGISVTQDSDTDGLQVLWSHDGTHIDDSDVFSILSNKSKVFTFTPARRFFKIIYTNGGVEADLDLQTVFKKGGIKSSSHRIQDSIVADDDAELTKSVLTGQDNMNIFRNAKVTSSGILLVSDYLLEVAKGNIPGENIMNKFGENPEVSTGTDPEDIWDGGGIYDFYPSVAQSMEIVSDDVNDSGVVLSSGTVTTTGALTLIDSSATFIPYTVAVGDLVINDTTNQFGIIASVDSETQVTLNGIMTNGSQEDFSTSPNTVGDSYRISNANDTGAATVSIYGLDENWESQSEIIVLNGQTAVDLTQTFLRINRMVVLTGGTPNGAEGTITCQIDGAGTIAAVIVNGNNQTLMTVYTIPSGRTGFFIEGYVGLSKGVGASSVGANFSWKARSLGGVFNTKGVMSLNSTGSGWWQYRYAGAPGLPEKTDIVIRCEEVSATVGVVAGMDILLIDN